MSVPKRPKIYHIVHVDRVESIVADGCLWCDAEVERRDSQGTTIGMPRIKQRRLTELTLTSHPGLYVGACVPFYFSPRSVMLYLLHMGNQVSYQGGQGSIVHLEADLQRTVEWAVENNRRWAFSLSNAGSYHFEDRSDLSQLGEIDWDAVQASSWKQCRERKQAEFLIEQSFPWDLVERIGVCSSTVYRTVSEVLPTGGHRPPVEVRSDWYY
jgi:hypothetical protein